MTSDSGHDDAIETLPSDHLFAFFECCWSSIFGFLDYRARFRSERSSKRLRQIVLQRWKSEHSFNAKAFTFSPSANSCLSYVKRQVLTTTLSIEVCSRIGFSLRHLILSVDVCLTPSQFHTLCESCPNVTSLDIFECSSCKGVHFDMLTKLTKLRLPLKNEMTNEQLFSIPASIEVFHRLKLGSSVSATTAADFLRQHPNLVELEVEGEREMLRWNGKEWAAAADVHLIRAVAMHASGVRRLSIVDGGLALDGVEDLSGMESFEISGEATATWLSNAQLVKFAERSSSTLRNLSLDGPCWKSLSVGAFQEVGASLRNLEAFELRGHFSFSRDDVDALLRPILEHCGSTLRRLSLHFLTSLTDKSLDLVAARCQNLCLLRLIGCTPFTAGALRRLIETVMSRSNVARAELTVEVVIRPTRANSYTLGFRVLRDHRDWIPAGVVLLMTI